ncbi:hypothetical protein [Actinoplanes awajinensis]|uniref:Uncharacterized protein n=1 Tax=Actinoplanes awajinensis subsp. mycoplanecinus TaxID=135947 RepID=A0A117MMG8_9ACTN|nr:hypothetical protein [Actinoplanes awajinensis]KUL25512.1 hypothetical protein ADL15_40625 [Actinoplanes awajinensis subsp. mycoplanecinus]
MDFTLDPPRGVGPLHLGMTGDEARAALATLGPLAATRLGELALNRPGHLRFSVGFGATRLVDAVELYRPEHSDTVNYRGVDVFGLPALQVVELLRVHTTLVAEDDGFVAPDLLLSLWRPFAADDDPAEEQGYYFQSVLLARPGYYDGPAEAAARLAAGGAPGF